MKTKILPLVVVLILIITSINIVAIGSNDDNPPIISTKTDILTFSELKIDAKGEYLSVNVEEANTFLMETGKPMLPVCNKIFTFPFGTRITLNAML